MQTYTLSMAFVMEILLLLSRNIRDENEGQLTDSVFVEFLEHELLGLFEGVSDNTVMNVLLACQGAATYETTYDVAPEAAPWLFTNARWTHMRTEFVALSIWPHASMTETLFVSLHNLL